MIALAWQTPDGFGWVSNLSLVVLPFETSGGFRRVCNMSKLHLGVCNMKHVARMGVAPEVGCCGGCFPFKHGGRRLQQRAMVVRVPYSTEIPFVA